MSPPLTPSSAASRPTGTTGSGPGSPGAGSPGSPGSGAGNLRSPGGRGGGGTRRAADAGVKDAIQSVVTNVKFKRMMVFGLRSLSEFCVPPTIRFKENSASVVESEAYNGLLEGATTFKGDEEVIKMLTKIYFGISEASVDDPSFLEKVDPARFGAAVQNALVGGGINDDQSVDLMLDLLKNCTTLKIPVQNVALGLISTLGGKMKPPTIAKVLALIETSVVSDPEAATALAKAGGAEKILQRLAKATDSELPPPAVASALNTCRALYAQGSHKASHEELGKVIALIERFRANKAIQNAGSACLAAMVSLDDLKTCLETIKRTDADDAEKARALTTLSSMSYISSFAPEVAKNDGIPMLVDVIRSAAKSLAAAKPAAKPDDKAVKSLVGAARMLSAVAATEQAKITDAGGFAALCEALAAATKASAAVAAVMDAIAPLLDLEANALAAVTPPGVVTTVVSVMAAHGSDAAALTAGVRLLRALGRREESRSALVGAGVLAAVGTHCGANALAGNTEYHENCVCVARAVVGGSDGAAVVSAAGPLCVLIARSAKEPGVAAAGCEFLKAACEVKDVVPGLQKSGGATEAALAVLLEQSGAGGSKAVATAAREILDLLATEGDVTKTLSSLEVALTGAATQPSRCLAALAAVNGLSQIPRMRPVFEKKDATAVIMKGIERWVEGRVFPELQKCIKSACQCVETLSRSADVDKTLTSVGALLQQPGLRKVREAQDDVSDNSLTDLSGLVEALAATQRFGSLEAVQGHIDGVLRIMRKYPETRRVQVACINALTYFATFSPEAPLKVIQAGGLRTLLAYMGKVTVYEDVQVAGCRLLLHLAQSGDAALEQLRAAPEAIQVIQRAVRTHPRSPTVARYGPALVAMLIPENEVEKIIRDNMVVIDERLGKGDLAGATQGMKNISAVCAGPGAAKVAARCDLGRSVAALFAAGGAAGGAEGAAAIVEGAVAAEKLTTKPVGVLNMQKNGGVAATLAAWEALKDLPKAEGKRELLQVSRRLLKRNPSEGKIAFSKGMVPKLCHFGELSLETEPELFVETCGVLGVMKPTKELVNDESFRRYIENLCGRMGAEGDAELKARLAECMDNLLYDGGDDLLDLFLKSKGLEAVYKCMDEHPHDPKVIRYCQNILNRIAEKKNLRTLVHALPIEQPLPTIARRTKRVLQAPEIDPDTAAMVIKNLNRVITPAEAGMLAEVDILNELENLADKFPTHEELMNQIGDYLSNVGCDEMVRSLIKKVMDCCEARAPGWPKDLETLNRRLALYLAGNLQNPQTALKNIEPCLNALADAMKEQQNNSPLITTVARVARRVARRSRDNPSDPLGSLALQPKMMKQLAELCSADCDKPDIRPRQFVIEAMGALAECARNPKQHSLALEQALATGSLVHADAMIKHHEGDPEVQAACLDYIAALSSTPEGAKTVCETLSRARGSRRIGEPQIVDDVLGMFKHWKQYPELCAAGLEVLGNLGMNPGLCPAALSNPQTIHDLFEAVQEDPKNLAQVIRLSRRIAGSVPAETSMLALQKARDAYVALCQDATVSDEDKGRVAAELAEFRLALAEGVAGDGAAADSKKVLPVEALVEMLEENHKSPATVSRITRVIRRLAELDGDVCAQLARGGLAGLMAVEPVALAGTYENAKETLELLKVIAGPEGQGQLVGQCEGLAGLLDEVHNTQTDCLEHEGMELEALEQSLKQQIAEDQPERLTLELVHGKWAAAKEGGEVLSVGDCAAVIRYFDFVADYTEEYAKETLGDLDTPLGREFMFGCKCYQLLHELESNNRPVMEKNSEPAIFLGAMGRQKDDMVCQHAVDTAVAALAYPENIQGWAGSPNAAAITATTLGRGRKMKLEAKEKQAVLMARLKLVELLAINRTYYNGTECMAALIGIWDDFDAGKYPVEVMKQTFQAMRRIVNDHWVQILLQNKVPKRLVDVVNNINTNIILLPDVLFLIAALAVVPEIKDMIGSLKGVEICLQLLTRSFKDTRPMSAVQTNVCLALSAITMGHTGNLQRFLNNQGIELNIPTMDQRDAKPGSPLDYDVAAAASVLMCNTCFKRDELKEKYGVKGACQAVMTAIRKYDGAEDVKAFRCLGAMFKAIGNLALYTPNVKIFVAHGIERTFAELYQKSDVLPDSLVEASLRTLSNLSMENTEENMMRFGVTITPILYMLSQEQRTSIKMFTLAFDVLALLCRLPANSQKFLKDGGVPTCLRILNTYSDPYLYANGIRVLGMQTGTAQSMAELVKHGVFDFLASLLQSQAAGYNSPDNEGGPDHDLSVAGFRCVRRLLKTRVEALEFLKAGGLLQCCELMRATPPESAMAHLEAQRVVSNMIALFPPPPPPPKAAGGKGADDGWDGDVADEGVLSGAEALIDRPTGPRAWQQMEMDAHSVSNAIESVCICLSRPENIKQTRVLRSGIGLLAYFAVEKIPGTIDAFYNAGVEKVLQATFENLDADKEIFRMACVLINNVAFASEPELYTQLRRAKDMRKALDIAANGMVGESKQFCDITLKLLNEKSADPRRFEVYTQWNFDINQTWWNKDKYPMGVQDLPVQWKEELRQGGKLKVLVNGQKEIFYWKSSMDLTQLQWRIDPKEGPMNHSLFVSRICSIAKGLKSQALIQANKEGSPTSRPREGESLVLRGLPSEEFPEGVELNVLCTMKRNRDAFFDLLVEWREAAAFGF